MSTSGATRTGAPPAGVSGAKAFAGSRSVYNGKSSTLYGFRNALAKAFIPGQVGRIYAKGSSVIHGFPVGGAFSSSVFGPVGRLRERLISHFGVPDAGTGWIPLWNTLDDKRFTTFTAPLQFITPAVVVGNNNAAATSFTFTLPASNASQPAVAAANIDVLYAKFSTAGGAGITISANGAAQAYPAGADGASAAYAIQSYAAAVGLGQAFTISAPANTPAFFLPVAIRLRPATYQGLEISDFGMDGTTSANWDTSSWSTMGSTFAPAVLGETPDVVLWDFGVWLNDYQQAVPVATSIANMDARIALEISRGSAVMGYLPTQPNPTLIPAAIWAQLRQAAYALADKYDFALFDGTDALVSYAKASAAGLMADNVHLSAGGCVTQGDSLFQFVTV